MVFLHGFPSVILLFVNLFTTGTTSSQQQYGRHGDAGRWMVGRDKKPAKDI